MGKRKQEHEYVDLGLPSGTLWATCNVGADAPEEYGNYYAWGETTTKNNYSWDTYKCGTNSKLAKYKTTDGLTTLEAKDDAATANWGEEWRMPTYAEWAELRENSTWTWTTLKGVNGYKVKATNGKSIFLPAPGFRHYDNLNDAGRIGPYWSSSLNLGDPISAWNVDFNSDNVNWLTGYGCIGRSVRPVRCKRSNAKGNYLTGAFSISANKQVRFSKGNLQYTQSVNTWSFAENQYDMLGTANISGGTEAYDAACGYSSGYSKSGDALADKIDLFGWSANNETAKWGISTSGEDNDYTGDFVDWGQNIIGTSVPNTYRTLTKNEWEFLIKKRNNASEKYGVARIKLSETEYANGLILLPDTWTCPAGVKFKSGFSEDDPSVEYFATHQTFTLAQWQKLEAAGAVFLPASGYRNPLDVDRVQNNGGYWSATPGNWRRAYYLDFYSDYADASRRTYRCYGAAVRLVKDL